MNARTVFLAGLAVALCNSAAYAKDCEIRSSELDAFAQYRLGPLKAMPKGVKRLPHCAVYPKYHAYDCEFVDAEGTRYLAADNDIAKIVRRARTSPNLPLSYPLKFGMPVEEAHRVLSAMDPKIDFSVAGEKGKGYEIDTGQCLRNSLGVEYWLNARFDKDGRLNRLEAAFETAED